MLKNNNYTILLCDANQDILEVTQLILESEGYRVMICSSGKTLQELILISKPDVIILDICLEDISGDNIAQKLRNDNATNAIPIILFSGLNGLENIAESTGTDFIKKPFDIDELKKKVKFHLRENATKNVSFVGGAMLHYKSPELPL